MAFQQICLTDWFRPLQPWLNALSKILYNLITYFNGAQKLCKSIDWDATQRVASGG